MPLVVSKINNCMKTLREYIDIVNEAEQHAKLEKSSLSALPASQRWDDLDNSSPYKAYRFGVALAGSPEEHLKNVNGPVGQKMMTIAYTDADQKILDAAARNIGAKPETVSPNGSNEMDEIYRVSPVKGFKGY